MDFILPTPVTDDVLTSSDVPENDYPEWVAYNSLFVSLSQGNLSNREGICVAPNGNVYHCVYGGDIYKQTAGTGDFIALSQTSRNWYGMCAAPNGNVYASVYNGDIYMQTNGTGDFVALGQNSRYWHGMCATSNGNVYAAVSSGDIYMQTGGTGDFVALGGSSRYHYDMTVDKDDNVYACSNDGVEKQVLGSGAFSLVYSSSSNWRGIAAAPNGNIYLANSNGDIYMQTNGTGDFVALGQSTRSWGMMCATSTGYIYCTVPSGDIYKHNTAGYYALDAYVMVTTPNIHTIYQSLSDNNFNNNPVTDTTDWIEIGSTNRWKAFNGVLGSQTEQATKIEYVLTPGESINSVALLNLESDTVDIVEIDSADDLVTNGQGFTGATGTTQPTSWDKVGTPADYLIDSGAIKITTDAVNEGMSQTITVSAATEYQLLFLYKNTAADIAQYAVYDMTHSADIKATTDLTSDTAYAPNSYVFTTPAGCTSVKISFLGKANGDMVWFYNIRLCPTEYSESVTTGASVTDVVKTDIPGKSTSILTVTVNKSGTAAIGELVIGNSTYIGALQYAPSFGIKDWSTITTDTFGNRTIVPRDFSKWLKCPLCVLTTAMDEVNRLMALYRGVNLVWVANPNYSSMIVYGIYTDYSQTWQHLDYTICNLEIEGLT
jgi:hypothetical protein